MRHIATVIALLTAVSAPAQLAQKAPPEIESALSERVEAFYGHFKRGEFRKAEAFLDEDSKDLFYNAKKSRIISYQLKTIQWDEDFRSATVLVACETIVPMLGSSPVSVPLASAWRYADGEWSMHLAEKTDAKTTSFNSPVGQMNFNQNSIAAGSRAPTPQVAPPTIESLSKMYAVDRDQLAFAGDAQQPVTQSVKLKNLSRGGLKVEMQGRELKGLEVVLPTERIEAGTEAEIAFTYRPEVKPLNGPYRIDFMVIPLSQQFSVYLDF